MGCGSSSSCCDNPDLPWFVKELPQPTTDDIELRVCKNSDNETVLLEEIEIYVQMNWRKIANVNMQVNTTCPSGLTYMYNAESGKRLCGSSVSDSSACRSTIFSVGGIEYTRVLG